jgi:diaminopimelate epimerase
MSELFRLSGAGNDFLALVEPRQAPSAAQMRAWCRRGVSLGADGVFVLTRGAADGEVAMDYFNADGGAADLCVNGTRCAAQLAFQLGWSEGQVRVRTGAGTLLARQVSPVEIELEVPAPESVPRPVELALPTDPPVTLSAWSLRVGVPHAVIPWDGDLASCPVDTLGPPVRRHAAFPEGANADFVRWPTPHEMEIRTFERGVEAETLACGTGVLAGVAVGVAQGHLTLPVRARTKGGFILTVGGRVDADSGLVGGWSLAGDARVLACAETFDGAEAELPEPPEWR